MSLLPPLAAPSKSRLVFYSYLGNQVTYEGYDALKFVQSRGFQICRPQSTYSRKPSFLHIPTYGYTPDQSLSSSNSHPYLYSSSSSVHTPNIRGPPNPMTHRPTVRASSIPSTRAIGPPGLVVQRLMLPAYRTSYRALSAPCATPHTTATNPADASSDPATS